MKINVQLLAKNDVLFYFESKISNKQCYKFYINVTLKLKVYFICLKYKKRDSLECIKK